MSLEMPEFNVKGFRDDVVAALLVAMQWFSQKM